MCTALLLDEIYPPTKFHNHSKYRFGDELRTKFKDDNKQRPITQKLSKQELPFMCTALSLDEIYPPTKFHTQNLASQSYGSSALHSPLMRSIHPQNFITIASIVLEICTGQNSSMKINNGQ